MSSIKNSLVTKVPHILDKRMSVFFFCPSPKDFSYFSLYTFLLQSLHIWFPSTNSLKQNFPLMCLAVYEILPDKLTH